MNRNSYSPQTQIRNLTKKQQQQRQTLVQFKHDLTFEKCEKQQENLSVKTINFVFDII